MGRWLTRFVMLPFLGAFAFVEALKHFILYPLGEGEVLWFASVPAVLVTGGFFFGLMHFDEGFINNVAGVKVSASKQDHADNRKQDRQHPGWSRGQ